MSSKTVPNEFEAGQPGHLDGLPGAPMSFGFRNGSIDPRRLAEGTAGSSTWHGTAGSEFCEMIR